MNKPITDYLKLIGADNINAYIQGLVDTERLFIEERAQGRLPAPTRKVIQIASQIDSVGKYLILAVCNDGTIWQLSSLYRDEDKDPYWEPFPNVPPNTTPPKGEV